MSDDLRERLTEALRETDPDTAAYADHVADALAPLIQREREQAADAVVKRVEAVLNGGTIDGADRVRLRAALRGSVGGAE